MLFAVRISSYGCTWEDWRTVKKIVLLEAYASLLLSKLPACIRNSRYTHVEHNQFLSGEGFSDFYRPRKLGLSALTLSSETMLLVSDVEACFQPPGGGGGVLGYILGGYVPPGSPNLDPVLERICTQNDTPF